MDVAAAHFALSGAAGLLQVRDDYKLHEQAGELLKFDRSPALMEFYGSSCQQHCMQP